VEEINAGTWEPNPSTAFIVTKPVTREIFAADFRDRIVHHLVIGRLDRLFEKLFIHDTYSCRKGKGTHFGVSRAERFVRRRDPAWVLKIDIRGYFMSIDRERLFRKLAAFIEERYRGGDRERIKELCRIIVFNDPTKDCVRRSPPKSWDGLPKDKSLFTAREGCGLPIGNFTSQIFANFYLSEFDHFIKKGCRMTDYGRYVDDCILVHRSPAVLKKLIPKITVYLKEELGLTLHPRKTYLQPCGNGVRFLGCFVKPSHTVVNRRTMVNFGHSVGRYNGIALDHKPDRDERSAFISSVNSYLGIVGHYKSYRQRKRVLLDGISSLWHKHVVPSDGDFLKITKRKSFPKGAKR